MSDVVVIRTRYGTSISIDPAAEGPMSVRELATLAARRLGLDQGQIFTLGGLDPLQALDVEAIAPTSGSWDLMLVGSAVARERRSV